MNKLLLFGVLPQCACMGLVKCGGVMRGSYVAGYPIGDEQKLALL